MLLPAAALAFLPISHRIWILTVCLVAFRVLGNYIGAAWGSLMSDYLPEGVRGRYLGWRSQVIGAAGVAGVGAAGTLLFLMRKVDAAAGFFLIFFAAALCRFISFYLMTRMADVPQRRSRGDDFTFFMFLRRFRESNFVRYVLYVASITFAAHLAAPYFSVYMLRDLGFTYLEYTALHLAAVSAGLLSFPLWGRHADLVGNARILKITSFLIPVIPFLWLASRNWFYLVAVEMFSGFVWGGFNLCATNFIFDAVTPPKRVRCLAYFNLISGGAIFAGASLGGFLAGRLPPLFGARMLTLFFVSGVIRLAAHFLLSPRFREVRGSAKHVSVRDLFFSVLGFRPLAGTAQEWHVFSSAKPPPGS